MSKHKKILALGLVALCLAFAASATTTNSQTYASDAAQSATYQSAIDSIADYNKVDALSAAIAATQKQIPEAIIYWDMKYAVDEIKGHTCGTMDLRGAWNIGCGASVSRNLLYRLALADGAIDEANFDIGSEFPAPYKDYTMRETITLLKGKSVYNDDAELKKFVDAAEAMYNRGVDTLRADLKKVDPSLTDLDSKNGDQLIETYQNLPAVKAGTYTDFVEAYSRAYSFDNYVKYLGGEEAARAEFVNLDEDATKLYGNLVAEAVKIKPDFTVDLSGVKRLNQEDASQISAELPQSSAPGAPDTGGLGSENGSANIVTVAFLGIAVTASVGGIIYVAKRYLFSPLKRRK